MKKIFDMINICAVSAAIVICLTGCICEEDVPTPEKKAVCFVLANTANSQGLNLNSPIVQDTIYDTIRNYGYISLINADGVPDVVLASSFDIEEKFKNAAKEKLDMDARFKATNLITAMYSVIAVDPEVDYMAALRLAIRSLSSLEGYDSKSIIVIGTGVSTSGTLNFQNNLISAEPTMIVEMLKEKSEIPDFSNITLYWQQMGDVAAPQMALTSAQRNKLQKIYGGIVEAGGGTFVYNDIVANPVNEETIYPTVTPVMLPTDIPISFEIEEINLTEPVALSEEQVAFIADKAEYLYPDEVLETLAPMADYLVENQVKILLCGTTAGDENNDFSLALSKERATKVKKSFTELGVNSEQILVVGMGSSDPWHIYKAGYEGVAASSNRKVVILNAASTMAQEIIAGTY